MIYIITIGISLSKEAFRSSFISWSFNEFGIVSIAGSLLQFLLILIYAMTVGSWNWIFSRFKGLSRRWKGGVSWLLRGNLVRPGARKAQEPPSISRPSELSNCLKWCKFLTRWHVFVTEMMIDGGLIASNLPLSVGYVPSPSIEGGLCREFFGLRGPFSSWVLELGGFILFSHKLCWL